MKLKERYLFLPFTHAFETMINRLMVCTVLAGLSCAFLTAQNVVLTGSLGGRVTDPSGAYHHGSLRACAESRDWRAADLPRQTVPDSTDFPWSCRAPIRSPQVSKGFRDVQVLVRVLVGNTTSQDIKLQVGSSAGHG